VGKGGAGRGGKAFTTAARTKTVMLCFYEESDKEETGGDGNRMGQAERHNGDQPVARLVRTNLNHGVIVLPVSFQGEEGIRKREKLTWQHTERGKEAGGRKRGSVNQTLPNSEGPSVCGREPWKSWGKKDSGQKKENSAVDVDRPVGMP